MPTLSTCLKHTSALTTIQHKRIQSPGKLVGSKIQTLKCFGGTLHHCSYCHLIWEWTRNCKNTKYVEITFQRRAGVRKQDWWVMVQDVFIKDKIRFLFTYLDTILTCSGSFGRYPHTGETIPAAKNNSMYMGMCVCFRTGLKKKIVIPQGIEMLRGL